MTENAFRSRGKTFDDADVARCYAFRPPYPTALFDAVLARAPGRSALLDLGTGPGKIAGPLASHFERVTAIDPSQPMLDVARELWASRRNIDWICSTAEEAPLLQRYDLATAGAAIHWMDPAILFPKLVARIAISGVLALISGDGSIQSNWQDEWIAFIRRWVSRMGGNYDSPFFREGMSAHLPWLDIQEQRKFRHDTSQSVEDFINCQHSRETFARKIMGEELACDYDLELRNLLMPHATGDKINFTVEFSLTIGRPRSAPITR